jgi:hypothetical protein
MKAERGLPRQHPPPPTPPPPPPPPPPKKGLSIPALFANLAIAAWMKFDNSVPAAAVVTAIMIVSMGGVAWHHRKWTAHILTKEQLELVGGGWGGRGGAQAADRACAVGV